MVLFKESDPLIAGARRRNADLNGDLAERAGSSPLRVEMVESAYDTSPSTAQKSLMVRRRELCATPSRSGRVRGIRRIRVPAVGQRSTGVGGGDDPALSVRSPSKIRVPSFSRFKRLPLQFSAPPRTSA